MKDYFGYAPALIVPRIMASLLIIIATRFLSPEEIGLYALVMLFGEYLDTIFCRWIRAGYSRLYFSYQADGERIDNAVLALTVPGIFLSIIFAFIYAWFDSDLDSKWAALLSLYVVANFILYQGLQFLRVRGLRKAYTIIETGRSVIGFLIAFGLMNWVSPEYSWLIVATQGCTAIAAFWLLAKMLASDQGRTISRKLLKELWHYSGPLTLAFFLAGTTLVVDRVMLEKLAGPAMLGAYAVSYQLARPAMDILFNIINVGGFPKLVLAYELEGEVGAKRVLYQKNVAIALVTFPVFGFILTSSTQISNLLLQDEYAAVAPLTMIIIAMASLIRGWVRFMVDQIFLVSKTTIDQVWCLIPAIISTVCVSFLLIPVFGIYGAALSSLIGIIVEAIIAVLLARRRMTFRVFGREIWIILSACVLGSAIIYIAAHSLNYLGWLAVALCVAGVYFVSMQKLGIFKFLRT